MSRPLAITVSALFAAILVSVAVLLWQLAISPWIVLAIVLLIAVFGITIGLLLVTNTRRPAGRDPDAPIAAALDPFGQTSEELRRAVMLPDQRPYGRRDSDDRQVVERLIERLEQNDDKRPPPQSIPAWALDLAREHEAPEDMFPTPPEELR